MWAHCLSFPVGSLFLGIPDASVRQASLRGFVTEAANDEPMDLFSVRPSQGGPYFPGAATNRDGQFVISVTPSGRYEIRASSIGYRASVNSFLVMPDNRISLDIEPWLGDSPLAEVGVRSHR